MGTEPQKSGTVSAAGIVLFGVGAIVAFMFIKWIVGVILLVGVVYFLFKLLKD